MKLSISISTKTRFIYALLLAFLLSGVVIADAFLKCSAEKETSLLLSDEENKSESEKFESKEGKNKEAGFDRDDFKRNYGFSQKKNDCNLNHFYYNSNTIIYLSILYKNDSESAIFQFFNLVHSTRLRILYHSLVFYDIFC
jgi:hypothetical protein